MLTERAVRGLAEQDRARRSFTADTYVAFSRHGSLAEAGATPGWLRFPPTTVGGRASQAETQPVGESPTDGDDAGRVVDDERAAVGALVLPDPSTEPRSGVCYWEFSVMADDGTVLSAATLGSRRQVHGSAAELVRDAARLGVGWLRQLNDADAYLETMWKGCWNYLGLDADPPGHWKLALDFAPSPESGWQCDPGAAAAATPTWATPAAAPACGTIAAACPSSEASPCQVPDQAPNLLTQALFDLTDSAAAAAVTPLPLVLGRSDRGDGGAGACDPTKYYDWEFINQEAAVQKGDHAAHFEVRAVDDLLNPLTGAGKNEDVLLQEFMRQLLLQDPDAGQVRWGVGRSLPYIQLGNELVSTTCAPAVGWLVLRLCELANRCAPDLVRVFPGLASPNNRDAPGVADHYTTSTAAALDEVFYHVVRAALRVRLEGLGADDATRFAAVLPGIEGAWSNDPGSLLSDLNTADDAAFVAGIDLPGDVFPFEFSDVSTEFVDALKAWCRLHLSAPFHVMDFHWYNTRGEGGDFMYLPALGPLVNTLRTTLEGWWSGGEAIPLWCTETGISSDRNPRHVREVAVEVDAEDTHWSCFGHIRSCTSYAIGLFEPTDPMNASAEDFEFRIDPDAVAEAVTAHTPEFRDIAPERWPDWVFTSEFEQAVQVWTRLTYLAGLNVQKVWWYTNLSSETRDSGVTEFYSYGLTEDLMVSVFDAAVGCDSCQVRDPLEDDRTPYRERSKKRAFCALKRWNQYLGRYQCAQVLPRFDGLDADSGFANQGFFGVVFRVAGDDADHPFALVTWTDPQVFSRCADAEAAEPLGECNPTRVLIFVPADPTTGAPRPRVVPVIPFEEAVDPAAYDPTGEAGHADALSEISDPCLADSETLTAPAPGEPGYAGAKVWRFGPDRDLDYEPAPGILPEVPSTRLGISADFPPVLILLPAGEIWHWDRGAGAVESLFLLDATALHAPGCA